MSISRLIVALSALLSAHASIATEMGASNLLVEKVLFISGNYSLTADRGEVWVKLDRSITSIHSECIGAYSPDGWLVAAFPDDVYAKQLIAGLLTAKANGSAIRVGVDDGRKNSRGMCFLSFYEIS